jgi:hypothetical protein
MDASAPRTAPHEGPASIPRGVRIASAFFALAGALDLVLTLAEAPRPLPFWPVWEAVGRLVFHLLLAWGLLRGLALCRLVAVVYCLASLATYGVAVLLAVADAPLRFPRSLILGSLFQVPSCALLLPWLRSPEAALWLRRPFFGP